MFMGEFKHTIVAKGRLIIPAKFRYHLGEKVVVGYPLSEWQKLQTKLATLPMTKKNVRQFVRFLYSAALECEFDKQGRVNLSPTLMKYASLSQQSIIVGVAAHLGTKCLGEV